MLSLMETDARECTMPTSPRLACGGIGAKGSGDEDVTIKGVMLSPLVFVTMSISRDVVNFGGDVLQCW